MTAGGVQFDFSGQVALITGGAGGIGAATARRLSRAGAKVASMDRAEAADVDLSVTGDVTRPAAVEQAIEAVTERYGRLDVLVCAAGVTGRAAHVLDLGDDDWLTAFAVNTHGTFFANRAAAAVMVRAGYGRIVNLSSIAGKEGNAMDAAYSASKAAVISLTKSLGKDLAGTGVLVNCVTPGPTRTPMMQGMDTAQAEYVISRVPLGRMAEAEEISTTIAFLASGGCSFATGAVYDVSGGRAVY